MTDKRKEHTEELETHSLQYLSDYKLLVTLSPDKSLDKVSCMVLEVIFENSSETALQVPLSET